jgi:hypothetical protein
LYGWNFDAYGEYRDISLDLPGINRLLAAPDPDESERAAIRRVVRRTHKLAHVIGDRFPFLGRLFASEGIRESLSDTRGYLRDLRGMASKIRDGLRRILLRSFEAGERIMVIGHSLGSVIAYDTFWELSHESSSKPTIDTFISLGSPLATRFVGDLLKGVDRAGRERYPTNIREWLNFSAVGETVALFPRLPDRFREMQELGLIEVLEENRELYNHFHGHLGLNVHVSYAYLVHPAVAGAIARAMTR